MTFAELQIDAALMAFGSLDVDNRINRERMAAALRADGGKGEAVKAAVVEAVEKAIKAASCGSDAYVAALVAEEEIHALFTAPQAECAPRADEWKDAVCAHVEKMVIPRSREQWDTLKSMLDAAPRADAEKDAALELWRLAEASNFDEFEAYLCAILAANKDSK